MLNYLLGDTSSDEETDEMYVPRRRALVRQRNNYFELFNEDQFFMRFRLKKETVLRLLEEIEPLIRTRTQRNNALSPINRLLLTLRFFATGSFLVTAGDFIGVSKAAAADIIKTVAEAIVHLRPHYIKMPTDGETRNTIRTKFYQMARFPRIIGAIDCTHIRIQSPGGPEAEVFRNRKGWFSKNVQVVAGPSLLIQDIVTRWPGSSHDQTIFNASRICQRFESNEFGEDLLLGDSGYECRSYIITPLPRTETRAENLFNESLVRTRQCVERLFGVWKRRFPILSIGIRTSSHTMVKADYYIVACAVLHNIACMNREEEPPRDPDVPIEPAVDVLEEGNIATNADVEEQNVRYRVRRGLINDWFAALVLN